MTPHEIKDAFRDTKDKVKRGLVRARTPQRRRRAAARMNLLIFDLDGTLIDSKLDLVHSVNAARALMNLAPISEELVSSYVGNGAPVLMRRALGPEASEADVARALEYFLGLLSRAHARQHPALSRRAGGAGSDARRRTQDGGAHQQAGAVQPRALWKGWGWANISSRFTAGTASSKRSRIPIGIETLLAESGIARERTIMVGDSGVDIRTARNARVKACGVSYGFQPETFEQEPPDMVVDNMLELADYVLNGRLNRRPSCFQLLFRGCAGIDGLRAASCMRLAARSSRRSAATSAAALFTSTMSRCGPRSPSRIASRDSAIHRAIAAGRSAACACSTPKSAGSRRTPHSAPDDLEDRRRPRGGDFVQAVEPCTTNARSGPSPASAWAISSAAWTEGAPINCRVAPAGLVSGPSRLNTVRIFSSSRAGCACFMAG